MLNYKDPAKGFRLFGLTWLATIFIFVIFIILLSSNQIDFSAPDKFSSFLLTIFLLDILVGIIAFPFIILNGFRCLRSKPKVKLLGKPSNRVKPTFLLVACIVLLGGYLFAKIVFKSTTNSLNRATPGAQTTLCNRADYYKMPPEFSRALSLIQQRFSENTFSESTSEHNQTFQTKAGLWYNCLNIQYDDLSKYGGAEGVFLFDENSSIDNLKIFVDSSYKSTDDIFTAILLSHEIRHAVQFMELNMGLRNQSCVDKEVEAFSSQMQFLVALNDEEEESLRVRLNANPNKNSAYSSLGNLWLINTDTNLYCGKNQDCINKKTYESLRNMVIENPYYQEECKGDIGSPPPFVPAPPEGNPVVNCVIQSPCNQNMQVRKNVCNNLVCCQIENTFWVATSEKCKQAHDIFNSVYGQ